MVNRNILLSVTVIAIFTLPVGVVWADEVTSAINYQGRLADSSGSPLSGTYTMTFRLYDVSSGGTALDTDTDTVVVTDGLFNAHTDFDQSYFDGRALWLGTTVSPDSEMTPRQELRPVPYALSLVPGAKIMGAAQWNLNVETTHPSGGALRGQASATSGTNYGVVGASRSPDGYGGYFCNNEGGVGVYGRGGEYGGYFDGNVYVSDNVGIGTTEPRAELHIYDTGTANFERALYAMTPNVADGSHAGTIIFGQSPATRESAHLTFVDDATAGQECIAFGMYGANDLMVLNGNGNVGIGTTEPRAKLHIYDTGTANFERALYAMTPNVADGSHAGTIIFGQSPATRESAHLTFVDDATAGQECIAFGMYGANDLILSLKATQK